MWYHCWRYVSWLLTCISQEVSEIIYFFYCVCFLCRETILIRWKSHISFSTFWFKSLIARCRSYLNWMKNELFCTNHAHRKLHSWSLTFWKYQVNDSLPSGWYEAFTEILQSLFDGFCWGECLSECPASTWSSLLFICK